MTIALPRPRPRRRPSLTPMIDVVFLLLVFFMLAARFGLEGTIELALAGDEAVAPWQGPPRLIEVLPDSVTLNGVPVPADALPRSLAPLIDTPADPVLIRAAQGAELQRVVTVMEALSRAGHTRLMLVE